MVTIEQLRSLLLSSVRQHRAYIEAFLKSPPQTNEVGRSAVLLGGFLTIAKETGLPLRLLEIGASAGLNTVWDRFRYQFGGVAWGDPQSAVTLTPDWAGPLPPLDAKLRIVERRACDVAPIDLEDPVQRLRLRAYVWADQRDRLTRLDGAIGIARASGLKVEQADAADWVHARLGEGAQPCATVLYHSIMWQYMPAETQAAIKANLNTAGGRATEASPLAWLRFESSPPDSPPELTLTLWPGPREFRLAVAHPHGSRIRWLG
jgi:hypothetical protein